ncbi:tRNA uridine-5-carboxymethylaminomethyl(34) synthesis GTPase MnmE [Portibacter lacus]|uniref:tRNA modification GTPase MnmE n=1 Tax=Portibacter lacus TaxID=1099794 RepID=A0AA37WD76_9BACT|nr:tRNA uridine-5-carboxymethylaminomethyl(34) synthesis GTPase MnmE [Portibacter lacus]GLR17621.1 tRNA modification GTPase MnmE [Portibacter lacus]
MLVNDTIVALSTPPGQGAIGVIRLSGPKAIAITDVFFKGRNLTKVEANTVHYGKIEDEQGKVIDECVATIFRAPKSYTREDVIELSCHGSPYILEQVIQICLRGGARMANRGEFTMRAFLNGQLDLSQAEAVADLIASENEASHDLAIRQMRGGFSDQIKELRQELIDFAALIELELDFGEEDVEFADRGKLEALVEKIKGVIKELLDSFHLGNVIKNGVATVIAGRPNAGKSTLLNSLLNENRAIVSDIAGTTRDTIEERLNINGIQFRLIDTAGIREAQDSIEKFGVERTLEKIGSSTVVVYMFDVISTKPEALWADVERFLNASKVLTANATRIFVANKMDLNPYTQPEDYYKEGMISKDNLLPVSALNKMNIEALKEMLYLAVVDNPASMDQTIVTNSRHFDALNKAFESLDAVLNGLRSGITGDFVAMDIRQALHQLGLITGEIHTDDLLDSIFTRFCIGK